MLVAAHLVLVTLVPNLAVTLAPAWSPRAHFSILQAFHYPHVPHTPSDGATPDVDASVFAAASGAGGDFNSASGTLTPAVTPQASNSLGLAIEDFGVGYVATIQMGTPPREFNLLMDSGSADLWVGAEGCISENGSDCVS